MEGRGSAAGHLAVIAMVLELVMALGALAVNHIVGGLLKWTIPAGNDETYYDTTWAASQTFVVGDTLEFQYTPGIHDTVLYNTLAEYTACSGTALNTYATGNDTVTLTAAGTNYFICSFPDHCYAGMKVAVTVGAAAAAPAPPPATTPSPSPSPSPLPSPSPSPSPSSRPSNLPAHTVTNHSPPLPTPTSTDGNAASSGPVLSMAGLLNAVLVASLAFLV